MSGGASLPSGCLLDRRVRTDFDDYDEEDLVALQPFTILRSVEKKASGFYYYQDDADRMVQRVQIGAHLADAPPGISCLGLRGVSPVTNIEAVDGNIVVLTTTLLHDLSRIVYLIYDSIKGSLHMIPAPESPSWVFTGLTVRVLLGRPSRHGSDDDDYALVLAGKLEDFPGSGRLQDALLLWRPTSSSSPPWSKIKKACFPGEASCWDVYQADIVCSINGRGLWVDLLQGISYCDLDALLDNYNDDDDDDLVVAFRFTHLPVNVKPTDHHHRDSRRVPEPKAFRTIGVTQKSLLVSIDGFLEHVELKDRSISIWTLGHQGWELDCKIRLELLRGFKGFGDLPKDMTPMYPLHCTERLHVVYFALGEYREIPMERTFIRPRYVLAVDWRTRTIQASSLADCFGSHNLDLVSSDFNSHLPTVGLDLHIMVMETMKQLALNSLDPFGYDEAEAATIMEEGPWRWQETLEEEDWGKCGSRALLPARYYYGPLPYGPLSP
ncbi:hypothetical protein ACQ4PT_001763 [Festuca glaucescens]